MRRNSAVAPPADTHQDHFLFSIEYLLRPPEKDYIMKRIITLVMLMTLFAPAAFAQQARCGDRLGTFRTAELWDGDYLWIHQWKRIGCSDRWTVKHRCAKCNGGRGREETNTATMTVSGNDVTIIFPSCTINGKYGFVIDAIFAKHTCGCCGGSFVSVESLGIVRN